MEEQNQQQNNQPPQMETPQQNAGGVPQQNSGDAEKNKAMAIIGYIIPILFFIPLLGDESKRSSFAKFHANQQLILLIAALAINIIGSIIPFIGWFLILPLGSIFLIVIAIMGAVRAAKGEMQRLPFIGKYEILK